MLSAASAEPLWNDWAVAMPPLCCRETVRPAWAKAGCGLSVRGRPCGLLGEAEREIDTYLGGGMVQRRGSCRSRVAACSCARGCFLQLLGDWQLLEDLRVQYGASLRIIIRGRRGELIILVPRSLCAAMARRGVAVRHEEVHRF
jgi:hypothetical protein